MATAVPGQPVELRSDAQQRVSVGLSQVFEGKLGPRGGDTSSTDARKVRILSINTSSMTYDFEQAKKPGFTGWATQTLTNSVLSDLVPGFNLSFTHDLWRGVAGIDTTTFDPFLQNVSASFALSGNTFRALGSIFGLGGPSKEARRPEEVPTSYVAESGRRTRPGSFFNTGQAPFRTTGRAFSANFNYQLTRSRPTGTVRDDGPRPAEPGLQHQLLAHGVLEPVVVDAIQHHRWEIRVAGRATGARAA